MENQPFRDPEEPEYKNINRSTVSRTTVQRKTVRKTKTQPLDVSMEFQDSVEINE